MESVIASEYFMSSDKKPDSGNVSAWERWQLPNMDADIPVRTTAYSTSKSSKKNVHELAEDEEEKLKPLTAEDLETIRQTAYEEGLKQGKEVGKAEGYDVGYLSGESDVKAVITRMSQICRALLEPIPKEDDDLEDALLQMIEKICKRVVHRELLLDSSAVLEVVREAIDCLNPGALRLKIHINEIDAELVLKQLQADGEWEENWRVLPHPTITPGGCIVETDNSLIDVRAEKRLSSIIQQVYEQQEQALLESGHQYGHVDQLLEEVESFKLDELEVDPDKPIRLDDGDKPANVAGSEAKE